MQRHSVQISAPVFSNAVDTGLYNMIQYLENNYWKGEDGVYNFRFLSNGPALVNMSAPFYFNVVRYAPTDQIEAWQISQSGVVHSNGLIEYADGLKGILQDEQIIWQNWNGPRVWTKVSYVPPADNPLDLRVIDAQAYYDTQKLGTIMQNNYYY